MSLSEKEILKIIQAEIAKVISDLQLPQGPQGERGEVGPQGIQGEQGLPGKDGTNGVDGNITSTLSIYIVENNNNCVNVKDSIYYKRDKNKLYFYNNNECKDSTTFPSYTHYCTLSKGGLCWIDCQSFTYVDQDGELKIYNVTYNNCEVH